MILGGLVVVLRLQVSELLLDLFGVFCASFQGLEVLVAVGELLLQGGRLGFRVFGCLLVLFNVATIDSKHFVGLLVCQAQSGEFVLFHTVPFFAVRLFRSLP